MGTRLLRSPLRLCARRLRAAAPQQQQQQQQQQLAPKVAIVGSGPAAFYTAQHLLKQHPSVLVDMFEKLPTPFGLVRYGVAPDHADVKNVTETFERVAADRRLRFVGNVSVGADVSLSELRRLYTAVVLAYGAARPRRLGICGEDSLLGVHSAQHVVNWYNGHPDAAGLGVDLATVSSAVVVGNGNVALDVARILLSAPSRLSTTDAPAPVLSALAQSAVRQVHLVGRRGLLQAAFTIKEFRDFTKMADVRIRLADEADGAGCSVPADVVASLPRPRRRLTELALRSLLPLRPGGGDGEERELVLHFLLSPFRFAGDAGGRVSAMECRRNRFADDSRRHDAGARVEPSPSAPPVRIDCGLAVVSVGYQAVAIDPAVPIDAGSGGVSNRDGRVESLGNVYCAGWLRSGASGVILQAMAGARDTAQRLLADLADATLSTSPEQIGADGVLPLLAERGVRTTSFDDWRRIDASELAEGRRLGKAREKLLTSTQLLSAAESSSSEPHR